MKNFKSLEEIYKAIKNITENKETEDDYFDVYHQNGTLEFWVKTCGNKILLLEEEMSVKEYEQLCYKLYKHHIDVYRNEAYN